MVMSRARGFTLPEIVAVVGILAILAGAGVPELTDFIRSQRVKSVSFDLYSTLVQARSEAVTRNASVTVAPMTGTDWKTGWKVTAPGGSVIRQVNPVPNVDITGPDNVVFRGSGRVNATTTPTFELTGGGWSTAATRCVSVDLSGRPVSKAATC
jgi:type IV fimbrial biogenesis protein FimT